VNGVSRPQTPAYSMDSIDSTAAPRLGNGDLELERAGAGHTDASYPPKRTVGISEAQPSAGPDRTPETERPVSEGRVCEGCGTSLSGRRPQARFCSDRCRSQARRDSRSHRLTELVIRLDETVAALARELETLR
jgi:predicted nucleic acid-binding Zn ribbon protein